MQSKVSKGHFTAEEALGMMDYHTRCGQAAVKQSEVLLENAYKHIEVARVFQAMHKELTEDKKDA